ncbi:MAG: orotidine-5'-phosphate decarboxylase [Proteobacteria bacterium]|nr:orotidine-5'-phosphate decarboxylase [Pseudomonadota bacterium]
MSTQIELSTELVVALDYSEPKKAEALIEKLKGLPVIYKVGLELYLAADSQWVRGLTSRGERIFLDLKFHDIPNTVAQAVIRAAGLGVEFVTVHLSGGKRMLDEIDARLGEAMNVGAIRSRPKVLGVSVLTSFAEEDWVANVSHMAKLSGLRSIEETVVHFADLASQHPGVQGMVCSPKEVEPVRTKYPDLYLMIPGIRMEGESHQDQKRVMTPASARKAGANAIVVGRSITLASDPRAAAEAILKELA